MRAQVSHELSVPAVTAMLLSALAFATAAWSGLALADALTPRARAGLQSLAALAALGVTVVVKPEPCTLNLLHPEWPAVAGRARCAGRHGGGVRRFNPVFAP